MKETVKYEWRKNEKAKVFVHYDKNAVHLKFGENTFCTLLYKLHLSVPCQ
jgi:hypothetical protein